MTKERFAELVLTLSDAQFSELVDAINQETFEYGWEEELENHPLINECWDAKSKG